MFNFKGSKIIKKTTAVVTLITSFISGIVGIIVSLIGSGLGLLLSFFGSIFGIIVALLVLAFGIGLLILIATLMYSVQFVPIFGIKVSVDDYGITNYQYSSEINSVGVSFAQDRNEFTKETGELVEQLQNLVDLGINEAYFKDLKENELKCRKKYDNSIEYKDAEEACNVIETSLDKEGKGMLRQALQNFYSIYQLDGIGLGYIEDYSNFCYNLSEIEDQLQPEYDGLINTDKIKEMENFLNKFYLFGRNNLIGVNDNNENFKKYSDMNPKFSEFESTIHTIALLGKNIKDKKNRLKDYVREDPDGILQFLYDVINIQQNVYKDKNGNIIFNANEIEKYGSGSNIHFHDQDWIKENYEFLNGNNGGYGIFVDNLGDSQIFNDLVKKNVITRPGGAGSYMFRLNNVSDINEKEKNKAALLKFYNNSCKGEKGITFIRENFYNSNKFLFTIVGEQRFKENVLQLWTDNGLQKINNFLEVIPEKQLDIIKILDLTVDKTNLQNENGEEASYNFRDGLTHLVQDGKSYNFAFRNFIKNNIYFNNITLNNNEDVYGMFNEDEMFQEDENKLDKIENLYNQLMIVGGIKKTKSLIDQLNNIDILKGYLSGRYSILDYGVGKNIYKSDKQYKYMNLMNPFPSYSVEINVEDSQITNGGFFDLINGSVINGKKEDLIDNIPYVQINITDYAVKQGYTGNKKIYLKYILYGYGSTKESFNQREEVKQKIDQINPYEVFQIYNVSEQDKTIVAGLYYEQIKKELEEYLEKLNNVYVDGMYDEKNIKDKNYYGKPQKVEICRKSPIEVNDPITVINKNYYSLMKLDGFNGAFPLTIQSKKYYQVCVEVDNVLVNGKLYEQLIQGNNSFGDKFFEIGRTSNAFVSIKLKDYIPDSKNSNYKKKIYFNNILHQLELYRTKSIVFNDGQTCSLETKQQYLNYNYSGTDLNNVNDIISGVSSGNMNAKINNTDFNFDCGNLGQYYSYLYKDLSDEKYDKIRKQINKIVQCYTEKNTQLKGIFGNTGTSINNSYLEEYESYKISNIYGRCNGTKFNLTESYLDFDNKGVSDNILNKNVNNIFINDNFKDIIKSNKSLEEKQKEVNEKIKNISTNDQNKLFKKELNDSNLTAQQKFLKKYGIYTSINNITSNQFNYYFNYLNNLVQDDNNSGDISYITNILFNEGNNYINGLIEKNNFLLDKEFQKYLINLKDQFEIKDKNYINETTINISEDDFKNLSSQEKKEIYNEIYNEQYREGLNKTLEMLINIIQQKGLLNYGIITTDEILNYNKLTKENVQIYNNFLTKYIQLKQQVFSGQITDEDINGNILFNNIQIPKELLSLFGTGEFSVNGITNLFSISNNYINLKDRFKFSYGYNGVFNFFGRELNEDRMLKTENVNDTSSRFSKLYGLKITQLNLFDKDYIYQNKDNLDINILLNSDITFKNDLIKFYKEKCNKQSFLKSKDKDNKNCLNYTEDNLLLELLLFSIKLGEEDDSLITKRDDVLINENKKQLMGLQVFNNEIKKKYYALYNDIILDKNISLEYSSENNDINKNVYQKIEKESEELLNTAKENYGKYDISTSQDIQDQIKRLEQQKKNYTAKRKLLDEDIVNIISDTDLLNSAEYIEKQKEEYEKKIEEIEKQEQELQQNVNRNSFEEKTLQQEIIDEFANGNEYYLSDDIERKYKNIKIQQLEKLGYNLYVNPVVSLFKKPPRDFDKTSNQQAIEASYSEIGELEKTFNSYIIYSNLGNKVSGNNENLDQPLFSYKNNIGIIKALFTYFNDSGYLKTKLLDNSTLTVKDSGQNYLIRLSNNFLGFGDGIYNASLYQVQNNITKENVENYCNNEQFDSGLLNIMKDGNENSNMGSLICENTKLDKDSEENINIVYETYKNNISKYLKKEQINTILENYFISGLEEKYRKKYIDLTNNEKETILNLIKNYLKKYKTQFQIYDDIIDYTRFSENIYEGKNEIIKPTKLMANIIYLSQFSQVYPYHNILSTLLNTKDEDIINQGTKILLENKTGLSSDFKKKINDSITELKKEVQASKIINVDYEFENSISGDTKNVNKIEKAIKNGIQDEIYINNHLEGLERTSMNLLAIDVSSYGFFLYDIYDNGSRLHSNETISLINKIDSQVEKISKQIFDDYDTIKQEKFIKDYKIGGIYNEIYKSETRFKDFKSGKNGRTKGEYILDWWNGTTRGEQKITSNDIINYNKLIITLIQLKNNNDIKKCDSKECSNLRTNINKIFSNLGLDFLYKLDGKTTDGNIIEYSEYFRYYLSGLNEVLNSGNGTSAYSKFWSTKTIYQQQPYLLTNYYDLLDEKQVNLLILYLYQYDYYNQGKIITDMIEELGNTLIDSVVDNSGILSQVTDITDNLTNDKNNIIDILIKEDGKISDGNKKILKTELINSLGDISFNSLVQILNDDKGFYFAKYFNNIYYGNQKDEQIIHLYNSVASGGFSSDEENRKMRMQIMKFMIPIYKNNYLIKSLKLEDSILQDMDLFEEYLTTNNFLNTLQDNSNYGYLRGKININESSIDTIAKSYFVAERLNVKNLGLLNKILSINKYKENNIFMQGLDGFNEENKLNVIAFNYFSYDMNKDRLQQIYDAAEALAYQNNDTSQVEWEWFIKGLDKIQCKNTKTNQCKTIIENVKKLNSFSELSNYISTLKEEAEQIKSKDLKEMTLNLIESLTQLSYEYFDDKQRFKVREKYPEICTSYDDCKKNTPGGTRAGQCVWGSNMFLKYFTGINCRYSGNANQQQRSLGKKGGPVSCAGSGMYKGYKWGDGNYIHFKQITGGKGNLIGGWNKGKYGHIFYVAAYDPDKDSYLILETNGPGGQYYNRSTGTISKDKRFVVTMSWTKGTKLRMGTGNNIQWMFDLDQPFN